MDALALRLSFGPGDAAVIDTDAAFVLDPAGDDVRDVLEFANTQLLEMRFLDARLDDVLEETYDPAETQPADRLSLSLRVEFQAQVVSGEDLQRLAVASLDANLPAGFSPAPETLKIDALTTPRVGPDGFFQWQLHAKRQLFATLPQNQAIQLTLGLSPTQASQRLAKDLPLAGPPQIALTPAWWPRLPILPFRIDVQIARQ